ncbi:MAG: Ca2+-binding protein [Nocardioides sp.]|jgi:Ca2+-binding RTX toxin-like protein|uniref:calcium-binding protein n=1 Tax=Nocardioides sp. TaxID=35761 RepID=UPI002633A177|nr:calcium-binding protein [Nocardioides sp.]MCW2835404.1 Ca2+-binding protein [Nocardioides sp.]
MHRHLSRSFAATGATALLATALLTAPGAQAAAATTCQGKTVTIDGTGQPTVTGTPGNDVISASQGSTVNALAGDDTICVVPGAVTSPPAPAGATTIDAGEGNDSVESGVVGQPNPDKISLGAGDDILIFHGVQTPAGSADFGDGNTTLVDSDGGVVAINATTKVLERNAVVALRWQGTVTTYVVESTATSVAFTGTSGAETFVLRDPATGATPTTVAVDMAGGDDTVTIRSNVLDGSTWAGGDGTDLFQVLYDYKQLLLDLRSGQFETGAPDVTIDQVVRTFENVDAVTATIAVKGSDPANALNLQGCMVTAAGRAGADTIGTNVELGAPPLTCSSNKLVARGGKDADTILGSVGADRLFGNLGEDLITANGGDDVIFGGVDADRVRGKAGNDKVRGGEGDDELAGNAGNDRVQGDQGNDRLLAHGGDDVLVGGLGFDRANGGKGLDKCSAVERSRKCES